MDLLLGLKWLIQYKQIICPHFFLGSYDHPQYGRSNSSFVGQMVPTEYNHDFGDNVVLRLCCFNNSLLTQEGLKLMKMEILLMKLILYYGNSPIKISIYRNNFFFRTFDPFC